MSSRPKVKKWHSTVTMPKEGRCCIFEVSTTDGEVFLIGCRKGGVVSYNDKYLCDTKLVTRWCYIDLLIEKE